MDLKRIKNKLKDYGGMVMFSHSLFSLPFGFIAMLWAENKIPRLMTFVWISVALMGARNGANAFNRIADRNIDKKNVRTKNRHLPSGKISIVEAYAVMVFCFALLAFAAYRLNPLCLMLLPLAIIWITLYSYTKRITWLCHYILGVACGIAPAGAWIAVTGAIDLVPIVLGAVVCLWVGGFDIIYALQDIEFDQKEGLYSIPARFGLKTARIIAALSHVSAVVLLIGLYFLTPRSPVYLLGVVAVAILLCVEHWNVSPEDEKKMIFASYSINQIVSVVFFSFCMLDFLITAKPFKLLWP